MQSKGKNCEEEEYYSIDLFETNEVLHSTPYEPEGSTTEKAARCNLSEKLIIVEVDVAIVFKNDLYEIAETHR